MDHVLPVGSLLQLSAGGNDVSAWKHMRVHTVGRCMHMNNHAQGRYMYNYIMLQRKIISEYICTYIFLCNTLEATAPCSLQRTASIRELVDCLHSSDHAPFRLPPILMSPLTI